ncbi:hypothetical protein DH2020_005783 [Rehmannia glutinosa]|uniref:(+)-lariciresinol reductase n=1 Tax=Rehmannia glutinosa TaxID=99300 RepID=A0ABR0XH86_REHGL
MTRGGRSRGVLTMVSRVSWEEIGKSKLDQGHETYTLNRPEVGVDIDKVEMLISFKLLGAHLVPGSFSDYKSLVEAVKLVDVVVCAISGVHIRSHNILLQLRLIEAIKEAGNFKFEFVVNEKYNEEAGIPFTYVSANCFAGYFVGGLCQFGKILPSRDSVVIHGDGNKKAIYAAEDDIATYTIKTIDDPRTLNKTLYLRPPKNILSQRQVVEKWEKLIGKELYKITLSKEDFLASMKGCSTNFEIGEEGEEASQLYPEVNIRQSKNTSSVMYSSIKFVS